MTLSLRFDEFDHVLRSIGDDLPGIIGIGQTEDDPLSPSLTVDPVFEPSGKPPGTTTVDLSGALGRQQTRISIEDAIAGCPTTREVRALTEIAWRSMNAAANIHGIAGRFDWIRGFVDLCEAIFEAAEGAIERMLEEEG